METQEKVRENRIRRIAARQGLTLTRSRRRDHRAWDYGTYMLLDAKTNAVVYATEQGYGLGLDTIEAALEDGWKQAR